MLDTVLMDEVNTTDAPSRFAAPAPASLEAFLAQIGPHAFRFAEASLRQREDALDAVQDAMLKMLTYRRHPPADWTSLFWRILRNTIVDVRRRHLVRLRWLLPQADLTAQGLADWLQKMDRGELLACAQRAHQQRKTNATREVVVACEELAA